jgi:hypothetical protein
MRTLTKIYFQPLNDEENLFSLMNEIIDHKKTNEAVLKDDAFVTVNWKHHLRCTTKGWKLCIRWMDGTTSWEILETLKDSNPADYAVANKLVIEPAFIWKVPHALNNRG